MRVNGGTTRLGAGSRLAAWRSFARLMLGSRRLVATSVAIALVQAALLVPIAFLIRRAFDETIPGGDSSELLAIGGVTLALFLASSILGVLNRWYALRATKEGIRRLITRLLAKVFSLPRPYLDRRELGTLHAIIVQDSERLESMAQAVVSTLIPTAVIGTALCATLVVLDPLLAAILLAAVPLMVLSARLIAPKVRRLTREWQLASDRFSSETQVGLRSLTLTKLHGAERIEVERREPGVANLAEAGRRMSAWHAVYYSAAAADLRHRRGGGAGGRRRRRRRRQLEPRRPDLLLRRPRAAPQPGAGRVDVDAPGDLRDGVAGAAGGDPGGAGERALPRRPQHRLPRRDRPRPGQLRVRARQAGAAGRQPRARAGGDGGAAGAQRRRQEHGHQPDRGSVRAHRGRGAG